MGVLYIGAAVLYLTLMTKVVRWAWRYGSKSSKVRAGLYAVLGLFAVYLPVFWDFIPSRVIHQQYCAKDAGVVLYVDPDIWLDQHKNENLAVKYGGEAIDSNIYSGFSSTAYFVNRRVIYDQKKEDLDPVFGIRMRKTTKKLFDVVDRKNLARAIDYYVLDITGKSTSVRFWMPSKGCKDSGFDTNAGYTKEFWKIIGRYRKYLPAN